MRKRKSLFKFLTIVILSVATFSFTVLGPSFLNRAAQQPQGGHPERKTIRQIVQERDIDYIVSSENEVEWGDPVSLTNYADAVVVGQIIKAESGFTKSGEHIVTNYAIDVERVVKDRTVEANALLTPGQEHSAPLVPSITLVREGGIVYVNGRRAWAKVAGYDLLSKGKTYIFFLGWSPDLKSYRLVGGISGVVLVNENSLITPLASDEKLKLRYKGTNAETFIRKVLEQ